MSRCESFYKRWRKDPNWCNKCRTEVSRINKYLGLVDELAEMGTPEDVTLGTLPERAARPILAIQDEETRENVISSVSNAIKTGTDPVTGEFVDKTKKITSDTVEAVIMKEKAKLTPGLYTSETGEWYTPREIIEDILKLFGVIDLDPCSNNHEEPNVPANKHFTKADDGLSKEWHGRVYMNPPYGREIGAWIEKLIQEYLDGHITEFVALVPARIDTEWFRKIAGFPAMWCGVDGRLKFSKSENSAPFPSAIFYLGERDKEFYEIFQKWGIIYQVYEYNGDLP